jgi:hypothetical protein
MMAENRSAKGMRTRKWATDENGRESFSPEKKNLRMHYDFKPDEKYVSYVRKYKLCFPLTFIKNFLCEEKT